MMLVKCNADVEMENLFQRNKDRHLMANLCGWEMTFFFSSMFNILAVSSLGFIQSFNPVHLIYHGYFCTSDSQMLPQLAREFQGFRVWG